MMRHAPVCAATGGTFCCAGTHDNETAVGWWKDSATKVDKDYLTKYLNTDGKDIAWDFIRSVYSTVSRTSIILIQVHNPYPHLDDRCPHPPLRNDDSRRGAVTGSVHCARQCKG